jgi:hypothetical protein
MNQQKANIIKFVQSVSNNNFKEANNFLSAVVNEKLKARIQTANSKLTNNK